MSCPRERELALYVEHDLPGPELAALQAHVLDCATCRSFLQSLEGSQQALKALAAEPIADEELVALRSRAVFITAADRRSTRLRWAFAAAVAAALLPGSFLAFSRLNTPAPATPARVAAAVPSTVPDVAAPTVPLPKAPEPTAPARRPRPMPTRRLPLAQAELSREEAVALANAVVAVSRIRSVEGVRLSDSEQKPPAVQEPLVRMATDDPNVVIYWRIESSGGK